MVRRKRTNIKAIVDRCWPTAPADETEAAAGRVLDRLRLELAEHDTSLRSLNGDGWNAPAVDRYEFQILTAISMLGVEATGIKIEEILSRWIVDPNVGSMYVRLHALKQSGLVRWVERQNEPTRFELEELGERALARARAEGKTLTQEQEDLARGSVY